MKKLLLVLMIFILVAIAIYFSFGEKINAPDLNSSIINIIEEEPKPISLDYTDNEYADWNEYKQDNDKFSIFYPQDWSIIPQQESDLAKNGNEIQSQRIIFQSEDGYYLNLYTFIKDRSISLEDWFKAHQKVIFHDSTVSFSSQNSSISNKPSIVLQKCQGDNLKYQTAFIDGEDFVLQLWINHLDEEIFKKILASIAFGQDSGHFALEKEKYIFIDSSCTPKKSSSSGDSDSKCTYQEASESSCCSQFTDSKVEYWNCSKNTYDEFGNCVWWAAYKRPGIGRATAYHPAQGDAMNWDYWAQSNGFLVDDCPREGDIYVDDRQELEGRSGHVAYVEEVLDNGKVRSTAMGWCYKCQYESTYDIAGRKFIHTQEPEVVFYPDSVNDVTSELNIPGSCNGKKNFYQSEQGENELPEWFGGEIKAILVPDGWSVELVDEEGNEVCIKESESFKEGLRDIFSYKVFKNTRCQ